MIFLKFSLFPLLTGGQTPLSNSKKATVEKCNRLLISKVEFNWQISQRNKSLSIDSVFSNRVSLIKNTNRKLFLISKSLNAISFILKFEN